MILKVLTNVMLSKTKHSVVHHCIDRTIAVEFWSWCQVLVIQLECMIAMFHKRNQSGKQLEGNYSEGLLHLYGYHGNLMPACGSDDRDDTGNMSVSDESNVYKLHPVKYEHGLVFSLLWYHFLQIHAMHLLEYSGLLHWRKFVEAFLWHLLPIVLKGIG